MQMNAWRIIVLIFAVQVLPASAEGPADIAPFAEMTVRAVQGSNSPTLSCVRNFPQTLLPGQTLQIEWKEPRDIRSVVLDCTDSAPTAFDFRIEWWHRVWPDNGQGGWMKLDDPFNGAWAKVQATSRHAHRTLLKGGVKLAGETLIFDFAPLGTNEIPGVKRTGFQYRHTYKIRIASRQLVHLERVALFSDAVERVARIRFEWDLHTTVTGQWAPEFEAQNGRIRNYNRVGKNAAEVEVQYFDSTNRLSADRGFIICRSGELRSFSVFVDDVLREGGLYVRDLGVFVSDADKNLRYASWSGATGEVWKEGTVAEQVSRLPEQSFEQVMKAIPQKPPNEIFLGAPALRQEIALGPKGDIRLYADSLRSAGPDAERRSWTGKNLVYQFTTGESAPAPNAKDRRKVVRSLADGWLPVVHHEWQEGEIGWIQTCVAAPLQIDIAKLQSSTGTEPVVLLTRFQVTNMSAQPAKASLWLDFSQPRPLRLGADGTVLLEQPSDGTNRPGLTPVRGRFNILGKGQLVTTSNSAIVGYTLTLQPNESHQIQLDVPYIELLDAQELTALQSVSFTPIQEQVVQFWKTRVGQGMTYEVPEKFLNEFFKANLWHVLISTDIDPVTGNYQHGAATRVYPNFLNETAMVARSLEMRGEHEEAYLLLKPFLDCQGVKGLPGNFKSKDGVFYAAHPTEPDPYTAQGYNMHHGWGLWAIAEHFFWTKDEAYLRGITDKLVKGCDWVTRERQATMFKNLDGTRPVEYGLAPAGDLEDVAEYLYFYATDAYYYYGMKQAAAALARIKHPESRRLTRDANKFLADIQTSVAESVAASPVVRLKAGTYIPYVPSRAYALTHLKEGWIREALYPALYMYDGEVFPKDHPYMDWVVQDQEDNIFLSKESGYGVSDQKANFFNFGGFTLQPNLPNLPLLYLERDQVPNFLRGFYNTCWASLYPDTMCFAEWVPAYGRGGGPLFKTPDECKFIQWMRTMLIWERGTELELGLGVPRAWMANGQRVKVERAATFFGKMDLEITSKVNEGVIEAKIKLVPTDKPSAIKLRLRHPDGKPIRQALVNGKPARIDAARQLIELPVGAGTWEVQGRF